MIHGQYSSPFGPLKLTLRGTMLVELAFPPFDATETTHDRSFDTIFRQLDAYFSGQPHRFSLDIALRGTDFQLRVWQTLQQIPWGETRSYSDIARAIGRPSACRAVAQAIGRNPVGIVIPCHRVIGKDGSLTGFGGGLPLKRRLLELEGHRLG